MSTKPGATILPVASIVSVAFPSRDGSPAPRRRTSTIIPSLTATSATNRSPPVPSTTVPPVILRSNTITPVMACQPLPWVNVTPLQSDVAVREGPLHDAHGAARPAGQQPRPSPAGGCDRRATGTPDAGTRAPLLLRCV